jgi:ABC-2 type transport system ATP-binding protein
VIEVTGLAKRFGGVTALDGVSFAARPAEVLGLLGPNGAGKSTALRIAAGFLAPSDGSVAICGHDVVGDSRAARAQLGYLPEGAPLPRELRPTEYLAHRAALRGLPRSTRRARIDEALSLAGVGDERGRIIGQLSRGYRQRVGLADALLHRPPVLLLDEPTDGLDPNQRRQLLETVRSIGRERTVVLSTHVLSEVEAICGNVVILVAGKVAAAGATGELSGAAEVVVEARGAAPAVEAALRALSGVTGVEVAPVAADRVRYRLRGADVREAAARAVLAAGAELLELRRTGPDLAARFAALTDGSSGS